MSRILISIFTVFSVALTAQSSFNLEEAIDYAIKHSCEMQISQLDQADAEARITEFKATGLPQVNGGIDYNYYFFTPAVPVEDFISPAVYGILENEFPGEVVSPPGPPTFQEFSFFTKHNLTAQVTASMLLFDGSYLTGVKAAKLYKDLTTKRKDVIEEEVKTAVTKAYMNILIAEENKNTLETNLSTIEKSLKEAEAYYENGFIERLEVTRIDLSKETLQAEITKVDQLINISKNLLKFQMAYPLSNPIELTEDLETLVNIFNAESDLSDIEIDFSKKAQFRQIEMGQELNELNIERLKKGYLPNVVARAGVSEALQRNNLFGENEAGWIPTVYAGLAINVPITDGKRKQGMIQQAEIEQRKTQIQKEEYQRSIAMQVETARLQHANAKTSLANNKRILEVTQDIYGTTLIKFGEGVGSSLEVTQAESDLHQAQSAYINSLYDLLITKIDLDIALGEL